MRIDMLKAMKEAGCTEIGLGIESFDQNVLDACRKNTTVQQNIDAIEKIHGLGMVPHIFMLIGTPGESAGTADRNIDLMDQYKGKFGRVQFSMCMPFPGADIHSDPRRFGLTIVDPDYTRYCQHSFSRNEAGEIEENPIWSPLRIDGLDENDQFDNLRKMRDYVKSLKEYRKNRIPDAAH
jgi:hypothetical protein